MQIRKFDFRTQIVLVHITYILIICFNFCRTETVLVKHSLQIADDWMTTKKKEVARERLLCTQPTFSQSLMVSVGISKLGFTDLVFVDPGVKINGTYYRDVLLSKQLLPVICRYREFFVLHQDNLHTSTRHCAATSRATPSFVPPASEQPW